MPILPLLKTHNYFISSAGFVFKIEQGREVRIKPWRATKSQDIFVMVNDKALNLLHLMTQHFIGDLKVTDKVRYTVNDKLEIQLNAIRVKPSLGKPGVTPQEEHLMFTYKCAIKANGANSRSEQNITSYEVLRTLQMHDFKCIYCGEAIRPKTWHLDHFEPISRQGDNTLENIVPSCHRCNMMKGAMDGHQFYKRCYVILKNYKFRTSMGGDKYKEAV